MDVSPLAPFQIIYSIYEHEFLGCLFESYIVQKNEKGNLTFQSKNISSKNAKDFESGLDANDFKLITLMDSIRPDEIHLKYGDKKLKVNDFLLKVYNKEKPLTELKEYIDTFIEKQRIKITELLGDKKVFEMGNDGEPTWREVIVEPEKAIVLFHFYRNEENTHYFPTIKHKQKNLEFKYKKSKLICNSPAWLLCEGHLYNFEKGVEGSKLKPFLNKNFIEVPRRVESDFFKKFGHQLIASFDVYAKGFDIKLEESKPKAVISFTELQKVNYSPSLFAAETPKSGSLFDTNIENQELETNFQIAKDDTQILFDLKFYYANEPFSADHPNPTLVRQEETENGFNFYKIKRDFNIENQILDFLKSLNLTLLHSKKTMPRAEAFAWIFENKVALDNEGITVIQNAKDTKKYFTGAGQLDININENIDWFDIHIKVFFGEFSIPFVYLKRVILKGQKEFKLPNGEIAIIPEVWFTKYSELFTFGISDNEKDGEIKLNKHHFSVIENLENDNIATVSMQRKLQGLLNFNEIAEKPLPKDFKGTLRPYQYAGYNWMHFLNSYKFGGCLADDMGLGKTVQTLAFLLSLKEKDINKTSLLVVPTSLIYNWELEAKKFTPSLKVHIFSGINRVKNKQIFEKFDLIITSYGLVRLDEVLFKSFKFNYVILDESQAIKNPTSATTISVNNLNTSFRLILTGTPIENSTSDLWSQMTFANPGLLGNYKYFKDYYQNPIEKEGDILRAKKLYSIVKPFILRRDKKQVAIDLPEKVESIRYCTMTAEQEKMYEETKSFFRNKIMDDKNSDDNNNLLFLQGLIKLRQLANHPLMVDENFESESGKMNDILHLMQEGIQNGRKILIFSQFVKHLTILKNKINELNIDYCYLDGSSTDRQKQVETFQNNPNIKLFLISLKAGGVGLNLTAADCVFILDPWWNPAVEAQAIDRAHRIGQTNTVFTYKFITQSTVEEKILLLQIRKKELAKGLISTEESFIKSLSMEDIKSILE